MAQEMELARLLREEENIPLRRKLAITGKLALPGILAQISEIVMQYIDAAMVGSLGAAASASIGLVSSSTWLVGSLLFASVAGFSVQVAQATGAGNDAKSRELFHESLIVCAGIGAALTAVVLLVSPHLPVWLGAEEAICPDATAYFSVYGQFLLVRMMFYLGQGMLQCTGNMRAPSILASLTCLLDVVFNYFLIFPSRMVTVFGQPLTVWGAGMGVKGAALGTALSFAVCAVLMLYAVCMRSPLLALRLGGTWKLKKNDLNKAVRIGVPMALEQSALCLAQVVSTRIVAPLGTRAIAANSFAVTAESLCYMPGYGMEAAATTLVGQAVGAKRKDMAESFAWITTAAGAVLMGTAGIIMYFVCPYVFAFLTPDQAVQALGVQVLRIELFAEPLFAASIVATGALRGAGDTLVPGLLNLISIWGVRITMSWFLAKTHGLAGVWIAMAVELSFRGILFLIRLKRGKWLEAADPAE